jgi:hypothetical protein
LDDQTNVAGICCRREWHSGSLRGFAPEACRRGILRGACTILFSRPLWVCSSELTEGLETAFGGYWALERAPRMAGCERLLGGVGTFFESLGACTRLTKTGVGAPEGFGYRFYCGSGSRVRCRGA